MDRGFTVFAVIVWLQAMTWACSSRPAPGVPASPQTPSATTTLDREVPSDDCAVITTPGEPIATVALTGPVDPSHAPHPTNESERLLFRQLYETLVRVDCMGRVRPGLAAAWRLDTDGRTWIVTLRDNAGFADGTPLTPDDVRASWAGGAVGNELRPQVNRLVESIVATGARTLAITPRQQRGDAPLTLAHPDLAIARSVSDSPWPLGTHSGRTARADGPASVTLLRDGLPPVRFVMGRGDQRDLLDQQIDLLLTRDPATLDYAATLPQLQSVPLAWQRTHVLLTPGRLRQARSLSEEAREVLADDAVRGEARGARGPFWWQMFSDCGVAAPAPAPSSQPTPRVVYDATDGASRDLAERLVGLAGSSSPGAAAFLDALLPDRPRRTFQRATGLTGEALAVALRRGTDAGYVMSVANRPIDPCRDLLSWIDEARWLDPETIVPLVETRLTAIVRRGRSGVSAEWDGGLVIAGVNEPR
jgi:hypothetical protein